MLVSPGIHVTSIYFLIQIVISVILREKSILWPSNNSDYFLHSCSMFLNVKWFIQSIILRHISVENFNHVKTFLLIIFSFFILIFHIFLNLGFVHWKKTCPYILCYANHEIILWLSSEHSLNYQRKFLRNKSLYLCFSSANLTQNY